MEVVLLRGYGLANVELGAPATGTTVYEVLSVGKQFAAAAALMLVRDGRLDLDRPASTYLPDLPAAWNAITVRQLLACTAGLPDYTNAPGWAQSVRLDRTPADFIEPVKHLPLMFPPGTQWKYSNTDYYIIGMLIERLGGKPFKDFVSERLFQPLGMTATRLNDAHAIVPGRAAGYNWHDGQLYNAEAVSPTQMWAAGGEISSAADLAKWMVALDTGATLGRQLLEEMWQPTQLPNGQTAAYGLGTELDSDHGHRSVGHQGGGLAFNASVLLYPGDHVGVVVVGNLTQTPSLAMAHHIAAAYLPAISDAGNSGIADQLPELTRRVGELLRNAAQGKVDSADIAPEVRATLVPFLTNTGPRFLGSLGTLDAITLLEDSVSTGVRTRRYRTVFSAGQRIVWTIVFAPGGTVRSLDPRPE